VNPIKHLPYQFDTKTKFSHYEMLWKTACLDLINKHIPSSARQATRILDVGSGRGEMMRLLRSGGYSVEGFDFDPVCVSLSSEYGPCKQGDIENIQDHYPEKSFDLVLSLHVVEHLENPKRCIENFMRLSNRYILLAAPNLASLPFLNLSRNISSCNTGHICGWNYSHLNNLLQNVLGLKIVEWMPDCVRLFDQLPRLNWLDSLFHKTGARYLVEEEIMKRLFPNLSNSLIVLAELQ